MYYSSPSLGVAPFIVGYDCVREYGWVIVKELTAINSISSIAI